MNQIIGAVSPPVHEVVVEPHVKVRMRDGVQLDATVWRPTAPGQYPVILERMGDELMGRMLLHEIDHLDGVLLLDRLDPEVRRQALRDLRERELAGTAPASGARRL